MCTGLEPIVASMMAAGTTAATVGAVATGVGALGAGLIGSKLLAPKIPNMAPPTPIAPPAPQQAAQLPNRDANASMIAAGAAYGGMSGNSSTLLTGGAGTTAGGLGRNQLLGQ